MNETTMADGGILPGQRRPVVKEIGDRVAEARKMLRTERRKKQAQTVKAYFEKSKKGKC